MNLPDDRPTIEELDRELNTHRAIAITPEQLAEWRRLSDAATPGPWKVHGDIKTVIGGNDADFIAAARIAVPALLDALEEAEVRASADKQIGRFIKAAADAYEKLRAVEAKSEERRRLLEKHQWCLEYGAACPECEALADGSHTPDCAWAKAMQQ